MAFGQQSVADDLVASAALQSRHKHNPRVLIEYLDLLWLASNGLQAIFVQDYGVHHQVFRQHLSQVWRLATFKQGSIGPLFAN